MAKRASPLATLKLLLRHAAPHHCRASPISLACDDSRQNEKVSCRERVQLVSVAARWRVQRVHVSLIMQLQIPLFYGVVANAPSHRMLPLPPRTCEHNFACLHDLHWSLTSLHYQPPRLRRISFHTPSTAMTDLYSHANHCHVSVAPGRLTTQTFTFTSLSRTWSERSTGSASSSRSRFSTAR